MPTKIDYESARRLFGELAASADELSEEELRQEFIEQGQDPDAVADAFGEDMLTFIRQHRRQTRRKEHLERSRHVSGVRSVRSLTKAQQRRLLERSLANAPSIATAGLRNYQGEIPDEEVEGLLIQLEALGLLAEDE